uniref:Uncharacterized protein n=1 Tax=Noctiluca scintillans TaxID=2966 RepID=A0A7S1AS39_NOCSC
MLRVSSFRCAFRKLSRTEGVEGFHRVNARFQSPPLGSLPLKALDNSTGTPSPKHWEENWDDDSLRTAMRDHALLTWGVTQGADKLPILVDGEGPYLIDTEGKRYLDWTSQAVCANFGYDVPQAVLDAVQRQLRTVPYSYGGMGTTPVRAKLSSLMAEICPGNLNGFLFPCGGGEANEAAIRMARRFTGKHKIVTQYRSYHGGSTTGLGATGDFRRWFAEAGATGFVKVFNPQPIGFSWGHTDESACERALQSLEETILMEGPDSIAAMLLEPVVGAGGCLIPPTNYMQGVRALCDKYNMLMICDEVMMGFFRTGPLFAFQHFDGVLPDIVTSAKGLTGAYLPLAMVAVRQPIKEFFETNPLGWGATYHAHPVAVACAYECVKHMFKEDFRGKVAALQPVMIEGIHQLAERHPSVLQGRAIGMFGCLDLRDKTGCLAQQLHQPMRNEIKELKGALLDKGIIGLLRPPFLHCCPPLIISKEQLREGFDLVSAALAETLDKSL